MLGFKKSYFSEKLKKKCGRGKSSGKKKKMQCVKKLKRLKEYETRDKEEHANYWEKETNMNIKPNP